MNFGNRSPMGGVGGTDGNGSGRSPSVPAEAIHMHTLRCTTCRRPTLATLAALTHNHCPFCGNPTLEAHR